MSLGPLDCDSFSDFLVFDALDNPKEYGLGFCRMPLYRDIPDVFLVIRLDSIIFYFNQTYTCTKF